MIIRLELSVGDLEYADDGTPVEGEAFFVAKYKERAEITEIDSTILNTVHGNELIQALQRLFNDIQKNQERDELPQRINHQTWKL